MKCTEYVQNTVSHIAHYTSYNSLFHHLRMQLIKMHENQYIRIHKKRYPVEFSEGELSYFMESIEVQESLFLKSIHYAENNKYRGINDNVFKDITSTEMWADQIYTIFQYEFEMMEKFWMTSISELLYKSMKSRIEKRNVAYLLSRLLLDHKQYGDKTMYDRYASNIPELFFYEKGIQHITSTRDECSVLYDRLEEDRPKEKAQLLEIASNDCSEVLTSIFEKIAGKLYYSLLSNHKEYIDTTVKGSPEYYINQIRSIARAYGVNTTLDDKYPYIIRQTNDGPTKKRRICTGKQFATYVLYLFDLRDKYFLSKLQRKLSEKPKKKSFW
jgi:hypothetical protein